MDAKSILGIAMGIGCIAMGIVNIGCIVLATLQTLAMLGMQNLGNFAVGK